MSINFEGNSHDQERIPFEKSTIRIHFAIHGHTAAELILHRADSATTNMGLTTWEKAPDGKIVQADVSIAKNYLSKEELESLGRIVGACLDLAEERARRKIPMTMEEWAKRLDMFLEFDDREILQDAGRVTVRLARTHAESEFEKYRIVQDRLFESDTILESAAYSPAHWPGDYHFPDEIPDQLCQLRQFVVQRDRELAVRGICSLKSIWSLW